MNVFYQRYQEDCEAKKKNHLYREIKKNNNIIKIDFTTNDYLGMSRNPDLLKYISEIIPKTPIGGRSSRLLMENAEIYTNFEENIANTYKKESALIFSSGYQLNSSVLPTLLNLKTLKTQPVIIADMYIHNSLIAGSISSEAKLFRYKHNDLNHLESLLKKHKESPKIIITEGVFSMEGTISSISDIIFLKKNYDAILYIDDAHGIGVVGERGYGCVEHLSEHIDIIVGTFSKAIGSQGAFIASQKVVIDYLINRCGGFIYSTAPSPINIAASQFAWNMIPKMSKEREIINQNSLLLKQKLSEKQFKLIDNNSHIVSILIEDKVKLINIKNKLLKNEIAVSAIREPTVPFGTSRLRVNVSTTHSEKEIIHFTDMLQVANMHS